MNERQENPSLVEFDFLIEDLLKAIDRFVDPALKLGGSTDWKAELGGILAGILYAVPYGQFNAGRFFTVMVARLSSLEAKVRQLREMSRTGRVEENKKLQPAQEVR
jgi:hypothetical protein